MCIKKKLCQHRIVQPEFETFGRWDVPSAFDPCRFAAVPGMRPLAEGGPNPGIR